MGTYLSTPVTEKSQQSGENLSCKNTPLVWGVVDMQGWRKSMEDAHVAQTDVVSCISSTGDVASSSKNNANNGDNKGGSPGTEEGEGGGKEGGGEDDSQQKQKQHGDSKVFGVFDGHGGPEVARFCQLYLVSVLTQQPSWKKMMMAKSSPHNLQPNQPINTTTNDNTNASSDSDKGEQQNADQQTTSNTNTPQTVIARETPVGSALVSTFHALDRMIDDPQRRDELFRLRAIKPDPFERQHATNIPPGTPRVKIMSSQQSQQKEEHFTTATTTTSESNKDQEENKEVEQSQQQQEEGEKPNSDNSNNNTEKEEEAPEKTGGDDNPPAAVASSTSSGTGEEKEQNNDQPDENNPAEEGEEETTAKEDDDSNEAVGKEEAAQNDQDLMNEDNGDDEEEESPENSGEGGEEEEETTAGKVSVMFQRLLNMGSNPASGQLVVQLPDTAAGGTAGDGSNGPATLAEETVTGPSASAPTAVRNGRMICNLPDHAVHAGATAIVAVIVGKTLTVANAGDSRAILCRGGTAYPLSFDHKPLQERELNRIRNAGGFVNHFGRVNGNLNLSRSIGDLKYKQVPNIPPPEQIITAEPDIVQVELGDSDEFLVLGCDGIWDCLTNEKAVEYVRCRLDTMLPTEIGVQMLNDIVSEDPRATQGIGGDNMTIMIVDFKPQTRSHRNTTNPSDDDDDDSPPS